MRSTVRRPSACASPGPCRCCASPPEPPRCISSWPPCRSETGATPRARSWVERRSSPTSCAWRPPGPRSESLARWWTPALSADRGERDAARGAGALGDGDAAARIAEPRLDARHGAPGADAREHLARAARPAAQRVGGAGGRAGHGGRSLRAGSALARACVLTGKGGAVFVYSPEEPRTQAEVVAIDPTPRPREPGAPVSRRVSSAPGQKSLAFTAQPVPRLLKVTGALRCVTTLDDGTRLEGCDARIPAGPLGRGGAGHGRGRCPRRAHASRGDAESPLSGPSRPRRVEICPRPGRSS